VILLHIFLAESDRLVNKLNIGFIMFSKNGDHISYFLHAYKYFG
jgi:hypothetical protein